MKTRAIGPAPRLSAECLLSIVGGCRDLAMGRRPADGSWGLANSLLEHAGDHPLRHLRIRPPSGGDLDLDQLAGPRKAFDDKFDLGVLQRDRRHRGHAAQQIVRLLIVVEEERNPHHVAQFTPGLGQERAGAGQDIGTLAPARSDASRRSCRRGRPSGPHTRCRMKLCFRLVLAHVAGRIAGGRHHGEEIEADIGRGPEMRHADIARAGRARSPDQRLRAGIAAGGCAPRCCARRRACAPYSAATTGRASPARRRRARTGRTLAAAAAGRARPRGPDR